MMKPEIKTETTTTKTHRITLDADALRTALGNTGITIPPGARIEFWVPRGGDYSGVAVDIDAENPIHIEWTETENTP